MHFFVVRNNIINHLKSIPNKQNVNKLMLKVLNPKTKTNTKKPTNTNTTQKTKTKGTRAPGTTVE